MKIPIALRALAKVVGTLVAVVLLGVLTIALLGWNWLRPPLERFVLHKTGRELVIQGDLSAQWGWPAVHWHAAGVRFANPVWAKEPQMLVAEGVGVSVDVLQLLQGQVVFPEVALEQATVFLEHASDGRKSWLLDLDQRDESARMVVGRVEVAQGTLGYDDVAQKTHLHAALSTSENIATPLSFTVQGHYKGLAVKAQGSGGPVLALRDTNHPYPLTLDATAGRTRVRLDGTVTGLLALTAVDMHMKLQGDSLEQLYPLLGIAFPTTRAYATEGHLLRSGATWRYEKFSGRVGASDIAGFAQVVTGGQRPALTADLRSELLALDDLGPVIGARAESGTATTAPQATTSGHVLPDLPFHATRWDSVDAEVQLRAKTLLRAKALPLENLDAHLQLRDAVLTLDPLNFGLAGGQLHGKIALDGRSNPIKAHAQVRARGVTLSKLFPTIAANRNSVGQVYGDLDLTGTGNSVGSMLATSSGTLGLVVDGGQISQLMMEKVGLHVWEIVALNLTGDRLVKLRCAVADFAVTQGKMQTQALVLDTQVTTVLGTGSIDLAQEQLDLTLSPKTKTTSPLALRSPLYVRGSFSQPKVTVDKGRVALRAAGALALGVINPLLALIPLVDAGPGKDSDCAQLVREANAQQ
ncbi:AsmA family protein [Rhodoferax saidenbachensis]|uniref:AsmA protein n=1 Tax=Rhodoferax saidenbachensis TaxID=1484693 RepID=A0ABU1ZLG3_9BURK|nr:AsmA family protein [Rhodoferax saidenbachensis]MDR7305801.1 AsmA protein [Rhodoferax saidenbachensis]